MGLLHGGHCDAGKRLTLLVRHQKDRVALAMLLDTGINLLHDLRGSPDRAEVFDEVRMYPYNGHESQYQKRYEWYAIHNPKSPWVLVLRIADIPF
ncbi:MAG: hypothetical protein BWY09_02639 [Candidatus Hydrogenedentes bacterium ADurb.Bin179]|nr:MAG: hypothetical protein BWY09_02639 [Candidatus Hydrogenedentes bacterium ADurb.Bin179]